MRSRRFIAAVAVSLVALLVLAGTAFLFVSSGGGLNSRENQPVNQRLIERSKKLRDLQNESNEARASISAAFDLLDRVFNLIRQPGGAGFRDARAAWDDAVPAMEKAREANKRLPEITQKIVDEAGNSAADIRKVFPTLDKQADREYVRALDLALQSLINTEVEYSKLNQALSTGFETYENLTKRTDKFFKEQASGKYRTPSEAAQVYTLGTSDLVEPLSAFRKQLDELETAAAASGAATTAAFKRASSLRQG